MAAGLQAVLHHSKGAQIGALQDTLLVLPGEQPALAVERINQVRRAPAADHRVPVGREVDHPCERPDGHSTAPDRHAHHQDRVLPLVGLQDHGVAHVLAALHGLLHALPDYRLDRGAREARLPRFDRLPVLRRVPHQKEVGAEEALHQRTVRNDARAPGTGTLRRRRDRLRQPAHLRLDPLDGRVELARHGRRRLQLGLLLRRDECLPAVADQFVGGDPQGQESHGGENQQKPVDDLAGRGAPGRVALLGVWGGCHRGAGVTCLVDGGRTRGRTKSAGDYRDASSEVSTEARRQRSRGTAIMRSRARRARAASSASTVISKTFSRRERSTVSRPIIFM